ncbi:MAG: hypothetical protein LBC68_03540 [Prevotellaceae bacterium]|jgi:hypothetical protein|nr:hypothetical protein [Prevotellaceae bacterium]
MKPLFGAGSACVVLKAKLCFAASRETCFYLRRSGTLRRTEVVLLENKVKMRFNNSIVNERCPVRDRMLVEENTAACMSRGLPTVFLVIDSAPRERQDVITFATEVVLLENKVKMRFNNSIVNSK